MENIIAEITDKDLGLKINEFNNPEERIASRGIVIRNDGKIAIFYKKNKNEYKLPGGGQENNESAEKSFKREVLEETGCEVEIIKKLGITKEYKSQTNFIQTSHVFIGKVIKDTKSLNITKKEQEEGATLLWEYPETALELVKSSYDKLISSKYDSVYSTKFVILRDSKILEYYLKER